MTKLFEGTEITTEPSDNERLAFGLPGIAGSTYWTWKKYKTWLGALIGIPEFNTLTWITTPYPGIKVKGTMDKYGGAFNIEVILDFKDLDQVRTVQLFPTELNGTLVRYEIVEHGLITNISGGLSGMNYTVTSFQYDGSDWTSSASTWGTVKGNGYLHSNNLDDSGTYISSTSFLQLAQNATLIVNYPTVNPGTTKGAINLTGYIRGYGDV